MKTHELAKALRTLARALESGPDIDVSDFHHGLRNKFGAGAKGGSSLENLAINLNTLAELSRVDRQQWSDLITHYNFPIELRTRDASRDVLGKLLRYLETHPEARKRLRNLVAHRAADASPELMRALSTLLKDET